MNTNMSNPIENDTITICPYWAEAVRLNLKNPAAIIANPAILSQEENEWMLREAAIIQKEELDCAIVES